MPFVWSLPEMFMTYQLSIKYPCASGVRCNWCKSFYLPRCSFFAYSLTFVLWYYLLGSYMVWECVRYYNRSSPRLFWWAGWLEYVACKICTSQLILTFSSRMGWGGCKRSNISCPSLRIYYESILFGQGCIGSTSFYPLRLHVASCLSDDSD